MHLIADGTLDPETVLRDLDAIRAVVVRNQLGRLRMTHVPGRLLDPCSGLADALTISMRSRILGTEAIELTTPIKGPIISDGDLPTAIIRDAIAVAQTAILAAADPEAREIAGLAAAFRSHGRHAIGMNEARLVAAKGRRLGYVGGAIPTISAFPGMRGRARFYDDGVDLPVGVPEIVRLTAFRRGGVTSIIVEAAAIMVDVEERSASLVETWREGS